MIRISLKLCVLLSILTHSNLVALDLSRATGPQNQQGLILQN